MCRSHYQYSDKPEDDRIEKLKFYKHLKTFLIVNGLLYFFAIKNGGNFHFMYLSFFWGIGILNHYSKVFGQRNHRMDELDYLEEEDFEIVESIKEKRKAPRWRDKDLV